LFSAGFLFSVGELSKLTAELLTVSGHLDTEWLS